MLRYLFSDHLLGAEDFVEALRGQVAQGDAGFPQGDALLIGQLRHPGGILIADVGIQRRDQHEGIVEVAAHLLPVGTDAHHAVIMESLHALCQEPGGLEEIVDQHRHIDVQLEIALAGGDADGHIIAHDLGRHHGDRLALGGIDLAGHDGGAGLILGDGDLAKADPGAGCQPADIVGDLHQIRGQGLQRSVGEDQLILGGQGMELIGSGDEGLSGQLRDSLCHAGIEARGGIEARTHGCAAQSQLPQGGQRSQDQKLIPLQAGTPAGDLLGEGDGRGILQVGAAGFDDALVFPLKAQEGGGQLVHGGDHPVLQGQDCRDMHGGGEGIVGGLGHIHIVIRVQELLPRDLIAPVRDHLVGVHIALGAGAGLPDHQGKMLHERTGDHLIAGGGQGFQLGPGHLLRSQGMVGHGGRLLQDAEGLDDLPGHGLDAHTDGEIGPGALGLGSPVSVGRHLHLAHRVMLDAVFHRISSFQRVRCFQ